MSTESRTLLFTGPGKGKTTAALGMAVRACGHGMRVIFIQFVKSRKDTGEITAAESLPNLEIRQTGLGWVPDTNDPEYAEHCQAAQKGLEEARGCVRSGACDMLVLDEICFAVDKGLINENQIPDLLSAVPPHMTVVLTGRGATKKLISHADTVTEMKCIKHALSEGQQAQKGVEY